MDNRIHGTPLQNCIAACARALAADASAKQNKCLSTKERASSIACPAGRSSSGGHPRAHHLSLRDVLKPGGKDIIGGKVPVSYHTPEALQ